MMTACCGLWVDELQGPEKELDFCLSRPGNCDWWGGWNGGCVKVVFGVLVIFFLLSLFFVA